MNVFHRPADIFMRPVAQDGTKPYRTGKFFYRTASLPTGRAENEQDGQKLMQESWIANLLLKSADYKSTLPGESVAIKPMKALWNIHAIILQC